MSTNCLVTKLKGQVNNSDLEKLGCLEFMVEIPANMGEGKGYCEIKTQDPLTVSIPDGYHLYNNTGTTQLSNSETFTPSSNVVSFMIKDEGIYKVCIKPKYSIFAIDNMCAGSLIKNAIDLKNFEYCRMTVIKENDRYRGDISFLLNSKDTLTLLNLSCNNSNRNAIVGTTDILGQFTKLTSLDILRCESVTGDISKLGNLTALTTLSVGSSGISGAIEDFIRAQYSAPVNPRTIGNISCPWIGNTGVTFQGSSIAGTGSSTIAWEPSSTVGKISVTISGGTPVDIDA